MDIRYPPVMIDEFGKSGNWNCARETEVLGDKPAPVPLGHPHVPHGLQWDWIWAFEIRIQDVTAWAQWSTFVLPASQIQCLWLFPGQCCIFLVLSHLVFFCSGENHVSYFLFIESQYSKKLEWSDPSNCAPHWLNDFTSFNDLSQCSSIRSFWWSCWTKGNPLPA